MLSRSWSEQMVHRGERMCFYRWAETSMTHIYSQTHSYVLFAVPSATYDEGLLPGHIQNRIFVCWWIIKMSIRRVCCIWPCFIKHCDILTSWGTSQSHESAYWTGSKPYVFTWRWWREPQHSVSGEMVLHFKLISRECLLQRRAIFMFRSTCFTQLMFHQPLKLLFPGFPTVTSIDSFGFMRLALKIWASATSSLSNHIYSRKKTQIEAWFVFLSTSS